MGVMPIRGVALVRLAVIAFRTFATGVAARSKSDTVTLVGDAVLGKRESYGHIQTVVFVVVKISQIRIPVFLGDSETYYGYGGQVV